MSMNSRHPSSPFSPPDKNHSSASSSSSSSAMLCSYPPTSSIYAAPSSSGASAGWSHHQRQQYAGVEPAMYQDHQRPRWQTQPEPSMRRDRRLDYTSVSPVPSMHSHHTSHSEGLNSPYSTSSQLLRTPTFDGGIYSRPLSTEIQSSSWNWEMDASSAASNQYHKFNEEHTWNNHLSIDMPHLDSHPYDNMLITHPASSSSPALYPSSNDQAIPLNGLIFPHRISPDAPSPSPSPVYHPRARQGSSGSGVPSSSSSSTRRGSEGRQEPGKEPAKSCSHCRATTTPLWRRDPSTMKPLCNACGLYLQQRNKLRPQELIDADDDGSSSEESDPNYSGPECSHCRTHHTSVWRRSKTGDQLCNACGVYARLRGKPRPLTLKKNKIRPRSKHSPK